MTEDRGRTDRSCEDKKLRSREYENQVEVICYCLLAFNRSRQRLNFGVSSNIRNSAVFFNYEPSAYQLRALLPETSYGT